MPLWVISLSTSWGIVYALPQSGKRIDEQLDLISITLNGLQKRNHVRIVHRLKLRLFRARKNDRIQGILPQIVQLLRLFQRSVQNAMNILTDFGDRPLSSKSVL